MTTVLDKVEKVLTTAMSDVDNLGLDYMAASRVRSLASEFAKLSTFMPALIVALNTGNASSKGYAKELADLLGGTIPVAPPKAAKAPVLAPPPPPPPPAATADGDDETGVNKGPPPVTAPPPAPAPAPSPAPSQAPAPAPSAEAPPPAAPPSPAAASATPGALTTVISDIVFEIDKLEIPGRALRWFKPEMTKISTRTPTEEDIKYILESLAKGNKRAKELAKALKAAQA
jgi:outer membrane biosynthesis protein TonB